ncbi:MAG: LysM domain-containing protein [Polyangiales bacterium]
MKILNALPWLTAALLAPALGSAQVTVSDNATGPSLTGRSRETIVLSSNGTRSVSGFVPEFHTVVRGDTLWGISGQYFTSPWQWPALWAMNPQITNPHWICPGDQVRLLSVSAAAAVATAAPSGTPPPTTLGGRIRSARVPRGTVFLREEAWASPEEIAESGTVVGAPEDNMLLSDGDQVYVEFRRRAPNIGETYTVYTSGMETRGSDRDAGTVVRVLGTVVIDSWDGQRKIATARITESLEPIERGERVAIVQRQFNPVPPVPNERDLTAHIVAMPQPRTIVGSQYVVIIDRGSQDGVRLGNRFFLTQRGDPWRSTMSNMGRVMRLQEIDRDGDGRVDTPHAAERAPEDLPLEVRGEVIVVASHPRTCVGLVTLTSSEIEIGAPVVMRRGY